MHVYGGRIIVGPYAIFGRSIDPNPHLVSPSPSSSNAMSWSASPTFSPTTDVGTPFQTESPMRAFNDPLHLASSPSSRIDLVGAGVSVSESQLPVPLDLLPITASPHTSTAMIDIHHAATATTTNGFEIDLAEGAKGRPVRKGRGQRKNRITLPITETQQQQQPQQQLAVAEKGKAKVKGKGRTLTKKNRFGMKLEFDENQSDVDEHHANANTKLSHPPSSHSPTHQSSDHPPSLISDDMDISSSSVDSSIPLDPIPSSPLTAFSRSSSRIRRRHDLMTFDLMMKESQSSEAMINLRTPTRTPNKMRKYSQHTPMSAHSHHHNHHSHHDNHHDSHDHLMDIPSTPTRGLPLSLPPTPSNMHMQPLLISPPLRRSSRKTYSESSSRSPSDLSSTPTGSPASRHQTRLTPFDSPDRASTPEFHSPSFSPHHQHLHATPLPPPSTITRRRYHLRHPSSALKTAFGVASPGMFSPAPSGMHIHAVTRQLHQYGEDSPNSTHSARQKLQESLTLDTPSARGKIKAYELASAPNSPQPQPLIGIAQSPPHPRRDGDMDLRAHDDVAIGESAIGTIVNHSTGGEPMTSDSLPSPTIEPSVKRTLFDDSQLSIASDPLISLSVDTTSSLSVASMPPSSDATTNPLNPFTSLGLSAPPLAAASGPHKPCNCKKSKCLKLYCECFARQDFCRGCNCVGCFNTPDSEHKLARDKAIIGTMERDPQAFFRSQLQQGLIALDPQKEAMIGHVTPVHLPTKPALIQTVNPIVLQHQVPSTAPTPTPMTTTVTPNPPTTTTTNNRNMMNAMNGPVKMYRKGCHCKKSECLKKSVLTRNNTVLIRIVIV